MDIDNLFTPIQLPEAPQEGLSDFNIEDYPRTKITLLSIEDKAIDKTNWDKEKWKSITGYDGMYQVSNHGRVRSIARTKKNAMGNMQTFSTKYLKHIKVANSYAVQLIDCIRYVHRLVAEAFIINTTNYNDILRVDGNRANNYAGNLYWGCSRKMVQYAQDIKNGLKQQSNVGYSSILSKKSRPIIQYTLNGEFVAEWANGLELVRCLNISRRGILRSCEGEGFKSHGFIWRYKNNFLSELNKKDAEFGE